MSSGQDNALPLSPLKRALLAIEELQARLAAERRRDEPIAVVGLACRFPGGADSPAAYWRLLAEGRDAVGRVPPSRWPAEAFYDADPDAPGRMIAREGGFLDDIESFDPAFFGVSPREAASMDPQHRLLLEVGWEALASSGQLRDRLAGSPTGVFIGITTVEYGQLQLAAEGLGALDAYHITGNALNAAAGRLSYVFGLNGPCLAVDTACSSSLVAVHLACASLRAGECGCALAGGVNLILSPHGSIALTKGRVLSPTGSSHAFDASADGMVRGEGCGLLVLKRLADARRDGDRVLALIRGSGVNQDGPSSGLTVPNGPAQEALLRTVLASAGVGPGEIGYIEAHGTGTALGDPIELGALGAVFGAGRPADDPLWVGSVKTNFGHLESAAGIAGLIKVILALNHDAVPAHLHFCAPSGRVPWDRFALRVPTALTPWPRGARPRLGGVSAFGFSGTNAHVLVQEAPAPLGAAELRALEAITPPFRRERFPLPRAAAAPRGGPVRPLLGRRLPLAGTAEIRFAGELSPTSPAFLGDHRVFGVCVVPAAAVIVMLHEAAREFLGGAAAEVRDLQIRQALAFGGERPRQVQTVAIPAADGGADLKLFSAPDGEDGPWVLHATARAVRAVAVPENRDAPAAVGEETSVAGLYTEFASRGMNYGPAFAALRSLRTGPREAVAEIALPAGVAAENFALHPVLLDAAFQTAGAALGTVLAGELLLPVGAAVWRIRAGAACASGRVHAWARESGTTVDLSILDASGGVVARLEGLELQRATRAALERSLHPVEEEPLLEIAWIVAEPAVVEATDRPAGLWLVAGGRADALAARLRAASERVVVVPGDASAEDFALQLAAESQWRGIVHTGMEDGMTAENACGRILALVQALAADGRSLPLLLTTRAAVPAGGATVNPDQAAVWGLARVIMAEHPEWGCRIVDFDREHGADDRLLAECLRSDGEAQIAWRGDRRFAARLERLTGGTGAMPSVRADGTYLVSGGLGALGLLTADWLVARGARRLILIGRNAPMAAATAQIAAWTAAGVSVMARPADVSDRAAMESLVAEAAAAGAPLRGVVHAAGVLDDGVLRRQTAERFTRVMQPKIGGARALDLATRGAPLDFFILYSSAAAVLGTPGQANYAAANGYLDGLALRRKAEGRPALSVAWGPWSAGMGAGAQERYAPRGIGLIDPPRGFAALERLLTAGAAHAAVLPVDWTRFLGTFDGPPPRLFADLADNEDRRPAAPETASADAAADPAAFLRTEAARVLHIEAARIGPDQALTALGLDSLMALELRNRVRKVAGVDLSVAAFLGGATLQELATELAARLAEAKPRASTAPIQPASSIWPLTAGQEALWFLHRIDPQSPAYHTAFALRLRGAVDAAAVDRALAALAARHPVLRAAFPNDNGVPSQIVAGRLALAAERVDAQGLDDAGLARRVAADYARPFDLEHGPLVRATLFRRSEREHVLLCSIHHIVSDAWTNWLLLEEFSRLYAAECGGPPADLAAPEATYADFGRWQRELLAGPEGERHWNYWRAQLGGALPTLTLPADFPRPAVLAPRGSAVPLELPADLMSRLRALAQTYGVTPFVLLLTAWQVWLHRHTGQEDIVVGTPTSGRSRPEFAGVAGYFVNPVPIRASLAGRPTFLKLLEQVGRAVLGALAHADLPLPLLVTRLGLPRDPARTPLFQTLFVYQKPQVGAGAVRLPGLEAGEYPLVQMAGQFELMLEIFEGAGASLKYHTELFTAETAGRMARRFRALLEAVAADPARAIDELPILDDEERTTVVRTWNQTPADYPQDRCLHELIAAQAARSPEAVAVVGDGAQLTFAQLEARANGLAHELHRDGVGPDVLVGVCAERSLELVVALLAVMKAGGAYVPLDPGYPPARLAFMREDSGVSLVLTQAKLAADWRPSGVRVRELDGDTVATAAAPPETGVTPDHLAYLIYTSGSTGRPKGVGNTHRGIVNRLLWMQDAYRLGADDRVMQKTPFSFDVSVWEFFWPLLAGARLVVAKPGGHQDAAYLAALAAREGVTTMHFVPSMLQAFVAEPGLADCCALRQVFCSGEALPGDLAGRFLERHGAALHNLYGPTEAAVDVSFWQCGRGDPRPGVPIGRPIARTQLYVLDRAGRPAPVGVPGELHIGGIGLARGYHRRPELTAEKFVPDPFGPPGARLYRTGDLARWLPEGALEYLGRLDDQVKLRGFRIELGEIESALTRLPGVREAFVIVREDRPGDRQLVAYLTRIGDAEPDPAALRRALREALPEHMIPADFVTLAAIPLSPNGKRDRQALPAPSRARPAMAAEFAPAATEMERRLAALWAEVLGREQVGVLDNFFDLGGHSLKLGQVHARIQTWTANSPLLSELFQYPTVRALAVRLAGGADRPAAESGRAEARARRGSARGEQRARRQGARSKEGGA